MSDQHIAEILHENGEVRFRYARYLAEDGTRWIRHGLFLAYHPDGSLASEGEYRDGVEHGLWRDFHTNGRLAAEGTYAGGEQIGDWRFWNSDGLLQTD